MSQFARPCFGVVRRHGQAATICTLSILLLGSVITGWVLFERRAEACNRTPPPNFMCEKSLASRKAVASVVINPVIPLLVPMTTNITSTSGPTPGNACPNPSSVTGGMITITMNGPGMAGPVVPGFPQVFTLEHSLFLCIGLCR